MARLFASLSIVVSSVFFSTIVLAQGKPHSVEGSPLDTILSTHIWADVAPAKDFVKENRPDPDKLEYAPLVGEEPKRIAPRNKADVTALRQQLEQELSAHNGRLGGASSKAKSKAKHPKS